ncbi:hypothetical protein [Adhaeribacter arboris]|uniref:hypothetical protein n=1 Tax=Adhaeribacter arboris TaxID=2072846 RepID=UPI0011B27335|nr:hypothetical protein [Adhaeribacter arboris]
MIWYGFRLYINRLRLQQAITLRQQEARQLRALDELKSRFFTNITTISGPFNADSLAHTGLIAVPGRNAVPKNTGNDGAECRAVTGVNQPGAGLF